MIICAFVKHKIYKIDKQTIVCLLGLYNVLTTAAGTDKDYSKTYFAKLHIIYNHVYELRIPKC